MKSGIIFGNLIFVIGGFLLVFKGYIDYLLFVWMFFGVFLVVVLGCVFNNYIDWDIDCKMEWMKNWVLVKGLILLEVLLVYVILLGIVGFMLLWFGVNLLVCWLGVMGFVVYVGVYSLYMKCYFVYGMLIGLFFGVVLLVIGYCVVIGDFDSGVVILLVIFSLWQMFYFYVIVIFCFKDYQVVNILVLLVVKGILVVKNYIMLYIVVFVVVILMFLLGGYVGYKYLVVVVVVSVWWLGMVLCGYKVVDDKVWVCKLFVFFIVVIIVLFVMMFVDFMVLDLYSLLVYVR